ncbi:plasmid stabilization system protein ParE [Tepidamorphus gemmatus]|uniref:Plasmid stabilization system protein ParE n=1 Tax=Tepidamorphus gemmatus TaxID=747076 RepID=A0A4R3MGR7_9HYPH|nr:type II toxin-antitoxin system RelE/ParE family toxin [Tepidamorphus gemmatus]TCT12328.1 plasmid stabilization system protein ParE [Tepidamorphus gemmatus]
MSGKPWRLTRAAKASLLDIALWTIETFGPRQAEAYEADLIDRCAAIARGEAPWQSCAKVIDPRLPEDLRFTRSGEHLIVFLDEPDRVIVIDFLHGRRDLPARLTELLHRGD